MHGAEVRLAPVTDTTSPGTSPGCGTSVTASLRDAERRSRASVVWAAGYVAVDELGEPRNTRHLREHAYRLMRELELRQVRLYDARHSCLTYLAVSGVPDVVLAAWAGHTNASFTKAKYVHPNVEDLRSAATVWDSFHSKDADAT